MSDTFEYDVFLVFASADRELMELIWKEMSSSGLHVYWPDSAFEDVVGRGTFTIRHILLKERCRHSVVICTQNLMKERFFEGRRFQFFYEEYYLPIQRNSKRSLVLLKIGDFDLSSLPPLLKNIQISDSVEHIISLFVESVSRH